ncbi:MAG TPA: dTDP-4-dehydrorhamnose reductase [Blastocatellia bacterium]|nr:dTDP-4-dehydrorhamnose reductase [Blastocatellia bacterium]
MSGLEKAESSLIDIDHAHDPEVSSLTSPEPTLAGPRTAMITGAGGLLGRSMSSRLAGSGWFVAALPHAELDITDEVAVREAVINVSPDVLINCVATADVDRCEVDPEWAYAVNATGPRFLARACREIGADIVHVSTDYVFDGSKKGFYTQEDEANSPSVYGQSKLAGEHAVREEAERFYIVRTSWLFGAGGKNFGSRVIEYARKGGPLKGVIDQTSIPTYAPDLAGRIEEIIGLGAHALYQVTSTGPTTWYEFARIVLDLAGLAEVVIEPVTRAELKQRAARPHNSAMRCLVSEKLGLTPLRHWKDALPEFVIEAS